MGFIVFSGFVVKCFWIGLILGCVFIDNNFLLIVLCGFIVLKFKICFVILFMFFFFWKFFSKGWIGLIGFGGGIYIFFFDFLLMGSDFE